MRHEIASIIRALEFGEPLDESKHQVRQKEMETFFSSFPFASHHHHRHSHTVCSVEFPFFFWMIHVQQHFNPIWENVDFSSHHKTKNVYLRRWKISKEEIVENSFYQFHSPMTTEYMMNFSYWTNERTNDPTQPEVENPNYATEPIKNETEGKIRTSKKE